MYIQCNIRSGNCWTLVYLPARLAAAGMPFWGTLGRSRMTQERRVWTILDVVAGSETNDPYPSHQMILE